MAGKIRLTKSEREIMDVLWEKREALTSSEIIKSSINKSWKDTSIHLLLRVLLKKNIIEVAGFKKLQEIMQGHLKQRCLNMIIFFRKIFKLWIWTEKYSL